MRAFPNDDWFKGLGTTAEGVRFAEDNSAVVPGVLYPIPHPPNHLIKKLGNKK